MADRDVRELLFASAGELAALVRAGEVSSRELVAASLERIEALDGHLNAFVEVDAERALAAAGQIAPGDARPFAGVPIAIKNNRAAAGLRLTFGCSLLADFVAPYDHSSTRRFRDAGFIVVGTTKLPEYGILPVSEARLFGPTHNPWDLSRTPGGSSGGAAAALAAGMVPVAHGNDGGGSLRIPAACCGLVGLKPTRGRVSKAPELGDSLLVEDGVLTRTVADTAALLDLLCRPELGDASWAPLPEQPFAVSAAAPPGRRRIAFTLLPPLPRAEIHPAHVAAVHETASLLQALGHELEEVSPPWQFDGLEELFGEVFCNYVALSIGFSSVVAGRDPVEADMEPMSWQIWRDARARNAVQGLGATARLQAFARSLITFLDPYDALLTPALGTRPLPIGALDTAAADPMETFRASAAFTPYTAIANASGQPAISLPVGLADDGLPVAVQLFGRPTDEATLLSLAAQLEEAQPWADLRPAVV